MATSFTVNKADLVYILKQIQIAEATSLAYTATPVSTLQAIQTAYNASAATASQLPAGLRTVDGTDNNLLAGNSEFGAADTLFPRLTDPVFRNETDGDSIDFDGTLGPAPATVQGNYGIPGLVVDADPRIISNLIVDMSVNNPAAIDAFLNNPLSIEAFEEAHPGVVDIAAWFADPLNKAAANEILQTIPNQSPDIGLSPGFNAWMTFFGQFFDHGLDLVTKGANGTVYVPLQADDPLIAGADGILGNADDLPPQLQFMALTRATPTLVNGVPQHENTTTSWIDQNQTYTSHASHQVFLREYARVDTNGAAAGGELTVSTGRLIDGSAAGNSVNGAIGNWGEVKAQALALLGINLNDFDVHNVPLLATDQYGKFIPGPNGYAQLVMAPDATHATNWLKEGNPDGSVTTAGSIGTNHAFLNDIAHHAAPGFVDTNPNGVRDAGEPLQTPDTLAGVADDGLATTYDDEMLNSHFVTGDGRGNENIALTTVHSIFHSEHNRLVEVNKATILASGDIAFINEWLRTDIVAVPADTSTLEWDGERLFQAARFGTEMQYQHLVFEEFARRIQPAVDPFIFNNSPNINPSIVAEFAHTVYRFGHSMLTGTVDRLENDLTTVNGDLDQKTLLAVFLNPQAYLASGDDLATINANLIRGLSRDVGNEIDEMIVTDVRSNLLGLPLDLGALNLARGRDTGIPSLNQTRDQLYNDTGLADLRPYTSWADFADHIKNPMSIINFIAAYGTHASITGAVSMADKRAAAEALVLDIGAPADRLDFLTGQGAYAGDLGGLNLVDLWIGGLAEAKNEFGGMLGSTFNYVFEKQMEDLQFGDRLYYLTRTQGLNFLNNLEPNTFSDLVMRNTDLGDTYSTHLNGALFTTPDHILELDSAIAQVDYNGALAGLDPLYAVGEQHPILAPLKVARTVAGTQVDPATGITHVFGGTLKFTGGEHVVLGGTEGNDSLYGDRGIDTLWGDGGNDYLNAGTESDDVFGGEGDDVIEDPFGDDVLRGNQGNDVITSARGFDLMFGDAGSDYIVAGQDAVEVFAGPGNDYVLGGVGGDGLLGNEGDDWIEGASGFDTLTGENSDLFFNSPIIGHDVLFGQGDEVDYDAESGDDIMGSGPSVFRYEGMFGFDWGIAKYDTGAVAFDLQIPIFTTIPNDILRDRFDMVEALSGWKFNDVLDGDDRGSPLRIVAAGDPIDFANHVLTQEGVDRIAGLNAWFAGARTTLGLAAGFRDGNILMGGDGSDVIQGRGGNDLIDGDAWLNVRIDINIGGTHYSAESMNSDTSVMGPNAGKVYNVNADGSPNFASPAFGGRSLTSLLLDRTINPGQMSIVREIKYDDTDVATAARNVDTAVFRGNYAEYDIEGRITTGPDGSGVVTQAAFDVNGDGFISVFDRDDGTTGATVGGVTLRSRGILTDGTDLLKNVEFLRFADQSVQISFVASAPPTDIRWNGVGVADLLLPGNVPLVNSQPLIANLTTLDPDTAAGFTYALLPGSSAGFAVSSAGAVTVTAASLATNTTYLLNVRSDDGTGAFLDETFTVRTGSLVADTLNGDATDNIMYALSGNDVLNGAAGNDTLYGQAGNDVLSGGVGNDVLNGGGGVDTASYAGSATGVTLSLAVAGPQDLDGAGAGTESDTLVSIENLIGSALNDSLTGDGNANVLTGGAGNDSLNGAGGSDTASYAGAAAGVTVSLAVVAAQNTGGAGTDTLTSIENLVGSANADTLTGSAVANTINGGAGADLLVGGGAADTIDTGAANDNLQDVIRYTAAADYGDTVNNFDANGVAAVDDRVELNGTLNTLFDDITLDDNIQFAPANDAGNNTNQAVDLDALFEALFLDGSANNGVNSGQLTNATQVAAEFNAEFAFTAANGEATLLVINDSNGGQNGTAIWQWVQAGGANSDIAAAELTLIALLNGNASTTIDNFDFV